MTDKSNNLVHLRWLPLLQDFQRYRELSWGSAVLAWTYYSLCSAAHRDTTNITGCTLLLIGLMQQSRDRHEARFVWTPYNDLAL
ncbi:hypothetical protein Ahy_B02g057964 [Arachis hypogaea]|uniref:Aminotransferase-like plant mobile domain-containing protein n=1 Tax=Arachis hypogaea TaxID=3818 RepID=A0A445ADE2_ARAHY|nr:hypothetical protein Ahy_B02g057964 [Arachis hypogaea]